MESFDQPEDVKLNYLNQVGSRHNRSVWMRIRQGRF